MIDRHEVPPAIMDRTLAGYLWFVVGGNVGSITRQKLIANCAYVMSPKNDIISKVRQYLTEVDQEKSDLFSALLLDNRAQRCLVHATLGFPSAVSVTNVDSILKDVRESVAAEILERTEAQRQVLVTEHEASIQSLVERQQIAVMNYDAALITANERARDISKKAATELDSRENALRRAERELSDVNAARIADVDSRIASAIKSATTAKNVIATLFVLLYLLLVWVTYDLSPELGIWKKVIAVFMALIGFWAVPQIVFKVAGGRVWRYCFNLRARKLGVAGNLVEYYIDDGLGSVVRKGK